ncbi:hypothetical protein ACIBFB_25395 [Nocardiopsis sp. NPDC050513]|uniref:hypothetical protein n=1 Tax=Nocardiopsis sp. NPDC050513 TaxID=3364338 RepID=UPI0037A3ECB5
MRPRDPGPPDPGPRAPAPSPAPAPGPAPERARPRHARPLWKRLRLPYLLALLFLLPLAVGLPLWTELRDGAASGTLPPDARPVAEEETVELAGSEWWVTGYVASPGEAGSELEGLTVVDVGFHVVPGDRSASELLGRLCRFRAVDGRGRSWEPTTEFSFRDLGGLEPGAVTSGCLGPGFDPIPPGTDQLLLVTYLVPSEAVEELDFELTVATDPSPDTPRPASLVFAAEALNG